MSNNHQGENNLSLKPHTPVMVQEVLACLRPEEGNSYLDLTAGYGGHAAAVIEKTKRPKKATLVDRDVDAVAYLKAGLSQTGCSVINNDFLSASRQLADQEEQFDMILADLGISSPHLEKEGRGFSFKRAEPLDMRMDKSQSLSAVQVVNEWPEAEVAKVLSLYGQEPKAKQIAKKIVINRPVRTTAELAEIAGSRWHGWSRIHPATRTFQAIRIAVNDELGQLEKSLPLWLQLLAPGGRLAIISFHSLEDKLVKRFLAEESQNRYDAQLQLLTKRPILPSADEIVFNPRARSAKLRAAVKIKTKRKGI